MAACEGVVVPAEGVVAIVNNMYRLSSDCSHSARFSRLQTRFTSRSRWAEPASNSCCHLDDIHRLRSAATI